MERYSHLVANELFWDISVLPIPNPRTYDPKTGRFTSLDSYDGDRAQPLSLHKYLYAHADPINGIDPNGMFYGASIGGAFASVSSTLSRSAAGLGAGLNVLDKAQTLSDAAKLVSGIIFRSTLDTQLAAGILISIVPFGNILSKARVVGSQLKGTLVGFADELADVATELRRGAKHSSQATRVVGDLGALAVGRKLGMEVIEDFPTRYRGIDGLFRRGEDIIIVEAKGGDGDLIVNAGNIGQMIQKWINNAIDTLEKHGDVQWAALLRQAKDNGRLKGMVVHTKTTPSGAVRDPVFELKAFEDIGEYRFGNY